VMAAHGTGSSTVNGASGRMSTSVPYQTAR
jgi:hypothetical protein